MGNLEGVPGDEFEKKYPEEFYNFFNNPKDYARQGIMEKFTMRLLKG